MKFYPPMKYLLLGMLLVVYGFFGGQLRTYLELENPSFEDRAGQNKFPQGWSSSTPDSTPDILPGAWGLSCEPQQGKTCVGLVSRPEGTREDLGQVLTRPLLKDSCYTFSLFLAHLPRYVGHNNPLRLRVWGGRVRGAREQLLDSSPLIDHSDWRSYKFQFTPTATIRYLAFEADYGPGVLFRYRGNILLDNCSPIFLCSRA
jgi:hypothetical protein